MTRWSEVRAIHWSRLAGAYGTACDVATALETLRDATTTDDDAFGDAWSDVLCGHVLHQGTIYPVTAVVMPFVLEIVEVCPGLKRDRAMRSQLALYPAMTAAAARRADPAIGAELFAAVETAAPRLDRWTKKKALRSAALAALLATPSLVGVTLGSYRNEPLLSAVLAHPLLVDPSARAWAAGRLAAIGHPVTELAAALLAKHHIAELEADRLSALAEALGSDERDEALDSLRTRFGIRVERRYEAPGETTGVVTVCEATWLVVRVDRNVTLRWPNHPFIEGDAVVLVDIDAHSQPRQVRGTADHANVCANFEGGRRVD